MFRKEVYSFLVYVGCREIVAVNLPARKMLLQKSHLESMYLNNTIAGGWKPYNFTGR